MLLVHGIVMFLEQSLLTFYRLLTSSFSFGDLYYMNRLNNISKHLIVFYFLQPTTKCYLETFTKVGTKQPSIRILACPVPMIPTIHVIVMLPVFLQSSSLYLLSRLRFHFLFFTIQCTYVYTYVCICLLCTLRDVPVCPVFLIEKVVFS